MWLMAGATTLGSLLWSSSIPAYEIRIDGVRCASSIHLLARDAPLSETLRQLAKSLGFEVRYEASFDPDVNIDSTIPASEAIARIGQSVNLSIVEDGNSSCANARRVTKVVVLPTLAHASQAPLNGQAPAVVYGTPEQIRHSQDVVDTFLEETHGGARHGP